MRQQSQAFRTELVTTRSSLSGIISTETADLKRSAEEAAQVVGDCMDTEDGGPESKQKVGKTSPFSDTASAAASVAAPSGN